MGLIGTSLSGSSGALSLTGSVSISEFAYGMGFANATTINVSCSLPSNYNAILYGPITIGSSAELDINTDAVIKIIDIENA